MLVEVCCGLTRHTETITIDEVLGYHGVDRAKVELTWMIHIASFYEVFYQRLTSEDDILEALKLFDAMNESIHRRLALGKFNRSILIPESLIAHHGVSLLTLLSLTLEEKFRYLVESIVAQASSTSDEEFTERLGKSHFYNHIVYRQCPFAIRKLSILLRNLQILNEVYIASLWYGKVATLNMQRRVGKDI